MEGPLVSVEMITYNHAPYIAKAIEGVLHQKTTFPFELVIGEDCSPDGTREIVFDYQKKYPELIRVITSNKNVGAAKNGSRTGKACLGKYIAFCEGDDYWRRPEKLGMQVDYLENHPKCGMVYSDYDRNKVGTGKLIKGFNSHIGKKPPENPKLINILRGQCGILTCTVCVRKNIFRKVVESDLFLFSSGTL
jgi:glycosyltransferase involved in cell wall biosynthesis